VQFRAILSNWGQFHQLAGQSNFPFAKVEVVSSNLIARAIFFQISKVTEDRGFCGILYMQDKAVVTGV